LNFLLLLQLARLDVHNRKAHPCPHNQSCPACRCLEVHKVCLYTTTVRTHAKLIALAYPVRRPRPYCPAPPQLHATSVGSLPPTNLVPHRIHSSAGGPPTLAPLAVYAAVCIKTYAVIPAIFRPAALPCIVPPLAHVTHSARSPHPGAACMYVCSPHISRAV
jgi:hypothetical protein